MPAWLRITLMVVLIGCAPIGSVSAQPLADPEPPQPVWTCWDDGTPDPCHNPLDDLLFLTESNGWAVGEMGTILHWNGVKWARVSSPANGMITSIAFAGPQDGWAVDTAGNFLHDDGQGWQIFQHADGLDFNDIEMPGPQDGWAVGSRDFVGTFIYHWDGAQWTLADQMDDVRLSKIKADPISGTLWAISEFPSFYLYRYRAGSWSKVSFPHNIDPLWLVTSMSLDNSGGLWLTGESSFDKTVILHENNDTWENVPFLNNGSDIIEIAMVSPTSGWISQQNLLYHWDGSQWSVAAPPPDDTNKIKHLTLTPNGMVWGVLGESSALLRWDGSKWLRISLENPSPGYFNALGFSSPDQGWAVARNGIILAWDGQDWTQVDSPTDLEILDVDVLSATQAWAVGSGGTILHWDGQVWSLQESGTQKLLKSIDMVSPQEGWAAGFGCTLLHWTGGQWQNASPCGTTPSGLDFNSIRMLSAEDGWMVGTFTSILSPADREGAAVLHWDGDAWSLVDIPGLVDPASSAIDLSMPGPNAAWMLEDYYPDDGDQTARIWTYQPDGWSVQTEALAGAFYTIEMVSDQDAWLGGTNQAMTASLLLHWDGQTWEPVKALHCAERIRDIEMLNPQDGWAVGSEGILLHYGVPSPPQPDRGIYLPLVIR